MTCLATNSDDHIGVVAAPAETVADEEGFAELITTNDPLLFLNRLSSPESNV